MSATTSTTTYQTPQPAIKGGRIAAVFVAGAVAIGAVTVATQIGSSDTTTTEPSSTRTQVAEVIPRPAGMPDGVWSGVRASSGTVGATRPAGIPDGVWAAISD
jgi:threonine dehydrogenase-like Zn-dependent dehydrogenase